MQGNVNGGTLTINGSGGTLDLGTGLTHTFTSTWTMTAGTLNGDASTLILDSGITATGGTFTAGTGTVELTAATTLPASVVTSFYNLTIASGTTTLGANTSVGNTLTLTGHLAVAAFHAVIERPNDRRDAGQFVHHRVVEPLFWRQFERRDHTQQRDIVE